MLWKLIPWCVAELFQVAELHTKRSQQLPHLVVQLAGDTPPLIFLRGGKPLRKLPQLCRMQFYLPQMSSRACFERLSSRDACNRHESSQHESHQQYDSESVLEFLFCFHDLLLAPLRFRGAQVGQFRGRSENSI